VNIRRRVMKYEELLNQESKNIQSFGDGIFFDFNEANSFTIPG
jgi:hypothetical protein